MLASMINLKTTPSVLSKIPRDKEDLEDVGWDDEQDDDLEDELEDENDLHEIQADDDLYEPDADDDDHFPDDDLQ
jgi:hypothetical protein